MQPEQLGPYRIISKLGAGAMGAVYKGVNEDQGQIAAIKVLMPALAAQRGFRIRFEAEIESLRKLDHPNIVRLLGFGEHEGELFYAMEFVDGTSLDDELRSGRRFGWREAVEVGRQTCKALKHAHDHGIIHRDLKPSNLMLTSDGMIKLADFGIAKLYGMSGMTVTGGTIGTASYMAPEQAEGGKIDPRADLYALGAVFYVLLAHRPPLMASSLPEMVRKLQTQIPDPIRVFAPDVPPEFEAVIANLLEKDPKDRAPTATAIAKRLQSVEDAVALRTTVKLPPAELTASDSSPVLDEAVPLKAAEGSTVNLPEANDTGDQPADVSTGKSTVHLSDPDAQETVAKASQTDGQDQTLWTAAAPPAQPGGDDVTVATEAAPRSAPPDGDLTVATGAIRQPSPDLDAADPSRTAPTVKVPRKARKETPSQAERDPSESASRAIASIRRQLGEHTRSDTDTGGDTVFVTAEEAAEHDREQAELERRSRPVIIAVGWLVFAAVVVLALVAWHIATRPASPEKLHASIMAMYGDGSLRRSPDAARRARDAIEQFRRLYPDNPLGADLDKPEWDAKLTLLSTKLRFKRHSLPKVLDGDEVRTAAHAIERAYIEAINTANVDLERGLAQLDAIIVLYDTGDPGQPERVREFVDLARRERIELQGELADYRNPQRAYARRRLDDADQLWQTDPEQARKICEAVITLHQGQASARELVASAQRMLDQHPAP